MRSRPTAIAFLLLLAAALAACDVTGVDPAESPDPWLLGLRMAPADDAGLSDSARGRFREDATRLAVRRLHELADLGVVPEAEPVEVPPDLVWFFYNGLLHVYHARALPQRDSVFLIRPPFDIRTFPRPDLRRFTVAADTGEAWVRAWAAGAAASGEPAVDSLVRRYGLAVSLRTRHGILALFDLTSTAPLNTRPLMAALRGVAGVYDVYGPVYFGAGQSDVEAAVEPTGVAYRFRLGWGDCPAGCTRYHAWTFVVGYDGAVRFGRSEGHPVDGSFYGP